jgi:hypothetical protein
LAIAARIDEIVQGCRRHIEYEHTGKKHACQDPFDRLVAAIDKGQPEQKRKKAGKFGPDFDIAEKTVEHRLSFMSITVHRCDEQAGSITASSNSFDDFTQMLAAGLAIDRLEDGTGFVDVACATRRARPTYPAATSSLLIAAISIGSRSALRTRSRKGWFFGQGKNQGQCHNPFRQVLGGLFFHGLGRDLIIEAIIGSWKCMPM